MVNEDQVCYVVFGKHDKAFAYITLENIVSHFVTVSLHVVFDQVSP